MARAAGRPVGRGPARPRRQAMGGGGAWKLRYVDEDLRIMDPPSLFVLKRRTDDVGLRDALADPARFMEDPD